MRAVRPVSTAYLLAYNLLLDGTRGTHNGQQRPTGTTAETLKGSVLGVILHDVCEEIRLEELRQILGAGA